MKFSIIAALENTGGIGWNGGLPWPKIKKDMWMFRALTIHSTVIIGRKTWESLPDEYRPLPKRTNVVVTSKSTLHYNVMKGNLDVFQAVNFETALKYAKGVVYVIGGQSIYEQAILHPLCEGAHITSILDYFPSNKRFPSRDLMRQYEPGEMDEIQKENGIKFRFEY